VTDRDRLRQALGHEDLAWLLERVRRRLLQGREADGLVTLRNPTPAQREALDRLLGRPPSIGGALSVRLDQVDQVLRHAEICDGLRQAVEELCGPVPNLRELRARQANRWHRLYETTRQQLRANTALVRWLDDLIRCGLLRRLSRGDIGQAQELLESCLALVEKIPARGMPIAELAALVCGDSHGLDVGRPLGTLGVRVAAALADLDTWRGSEARREAWARVGVLCDELSGPVLVLGLTAADDGLTSRALRLHAEAGEPYRVTARQLLRHRPCLAPVVANRAVFICENPSVVAAAANRLGADCAPLICTDGQPRTPARLLLGLLSAAGAELHYHGDFDWPGIHIANLIIYRYLARPWRMATDDYLATTGGTKLQGRPVPADWDYDLDAAMLEQGRAVHEEQVLNDLINDLCIGTHSSAPAS
jgi:uncharacterized protein (TIGR02679 family)